MIKKGILLIVVTLLLGSCVAVKAYSQEAFMKYTVNGVAYSFKGNQAQCYQKEGDKDENDKVDFQETTGYLNYTVEAAEKIGFKIRVEKGKKLAVGRYTIQGLLDQTKILPNVHIKLEVETTEGLIFYNANGPDNGVFEITKIAGGWIEGTFEVTIPDDFDEDNITYIKVTNGSFRLKVKTF